MLACPEVEYQRRPASTVEGHCTPFTGVKNLEWHVDNLEAETDNRFDYVQATVQDPFHPGR